MKPQVMTLGTAQAILRQFVNKLAQRQLAPLLQVGTDLAQVRPKAFLCAEEVITGRAIMVVAGHRHLGQL